MDAFQDELPAIDYLAKDYASFRRLMLDHLALRVPSWQESSEADQGNMIVEILAYAADYLSYYQDAVATEAYLGTARQRPSLKRHVRQLDYLLHEGCNARAWVQIDVSKPLILPKGTQLLTHAGSLVTSPLIAPNSSAYEDALRQQTKLFETMHDSRLLPAHNEIALYAEDGEEATLPMGSTSALLLDSRDPQSKLELRVGDVLIFEEVKNVNTGERIGVDLTRRHAVRLTAIAPAARATSSLLRVTWGDDDALPFPLRLTVNHQGDLISEICVARGNIVLADHGQSISYEPLPSVLPHRRYHPYLHHTELTHRVPYHHASARIQPAKSTLQQDVQQALPAIALFTQSRSEPLPVQPELAPEFNRLLVSHALRTGLHASGVVLSQQVRISTVAGIGWELHDKLHNRHWLASQKGQELLLNTLKPWHLQRDLLSSDPLAYDYTVDMEEDRRARLRFGSGIQGRQPRPEDRFVATYRIGGGTQGNVRADTITHVVTTDVRITQVRNPLGSQGGSDPESIEEARLDAPYAFRTQQRGITEQDYAELAQRNPHVANAVAHIRWVGSFSTVFLYVQRVENRTIDAAFKAELQRFLEHFRLAGHEVEICAPYFVALSILLRVSLYPHAARSSVSEQLAQAFTNTRGGFFAPENFTFGQTVYLSQIVSTAMEIAGIERVEVERFRRFDTTSSPQAPIEPLILQPLEIVRLDNDASAPYNGTITFHLEGGL